MKKIAAGLVPVALWAIGPGLYAQPSIDHAALECIAPGQFAVVLSGIDHLRSPAPQPITLQTHLALPPFDGSARGRLIFEGAAARMVDSSHSAELSVPAAAGMRRVEAVVTRAGAGPGEWRFDFARESRFVQGSLRAVQGNVLAVETSTIVFRVTGQAQERLSFTFELAP